MAKKIITENTNLTREELEILAKVPNDVFLFSLFCYVIHPVRGKVRFELYPYQKSVLYQFVKERFNILLKFRQAGITELISMYCLWLAMYHPNKKINIISIKDTTAKKVLKKIKFMYKNLPWYLQTPIINGRAGEFGSASMIEFDNGSFIESIPTSSEAGRSESLSLLVIDEAAIVRWAAQIWAAAFPTLSCLSGSYKIFYKKSIKLPRTKNKYGSEIGTIRMDEIGPKKKGVKDLYDSNLYTLTHTGEWKRILWSQNKGKLKTLLLRDSKGVEIECTPRHRFLTIQGWKKASEILSENLDIIQMDLGIEKLINPPVTEPPKLEKIKPIEGFPRFFVTNLGRVLRKNSNCGFEEVKQHINKRFYYDVGLIKDGKTYTKKVSRLVAQAFIGPIPEGYFVDHIDCNKEHNYVTNLQIITNSENVKRGRDFSIGATLSNVVGKINPVTHGLILALREEYKDKSHAYLSSILKSKYGLDISRRTLTNILNRTPVYLSKLTLIEERESTIYDVHVEDNHSYITTNGYINHNTGGSAIVNSCITGNTKIITDRGLIKVRNLCPKKFGAVDLSYVSNLKVLTHKGEWKRIIASVNKGKLETWKIQTKYGTTLNCTPNHKLYTLHGWMSVKDIIEKKEKVILYKTGLSELQEPPRIMWPEKEVWKTVKDYPNYKISNRGELKYLRAGKWYKKHLKPNDDGYVRVTLHRDRSSKPFRMADLVISHFTDLKVGKGQVIDHIDCVPHHNWVTNLQVISRKENTQRANLYSYGLKLGTRIGKSFTDLDSLAIVLNAIETGELEQKGITQFIKENSVFNSMSLKSARSYISKILSDKRGNQVKLSTLKVLRKFKTTIYDITVEDHHSYITYNFNKKRRGQEEYNFINKNTPYGVGNFYHSTWVDAIAGGNPFNPIRLYWQMHPERDENWYKQMASALGPKRTAQEIDGDFLSSGNTVFDLADIKAIEDCLGDYPVIKKRFNGQYRQYLEPQSDKEYFIGADVSTGRASDYSAFTCMDKQGEEQAVYKGRMPLDKYARLLGDTGQLYNWATLAPESNDVGMAVTSKLQDEGYPKLYYYQKMLKKKGKSRPEVDKSPGWLTTQKNRSVIIENLEQDIREENAIIKDPFFVQEAYTFIYDGLGRPVAMGKHRANNSAVDIDLEGDVYSDDSIFGKAICNHIRKGKTNIIVQPK
nr:MAG: Terminase [Bacteriophage sp.]